MHGDELGGLINELTRRHQKTIEQLMNLFASVGGADVFERATQVIGPGLAAAEWLTSDKLGLDGEIPALLALDPKGRERVMTFLTQIEHGIYV